LPFLLIDDIIRKKGKSRLNIRNFVLSYYGNDIDGIHIQKIDKPKEAKELHTHPYYQIYYVEKGTLTHCADNCSSQLLAGDVFIIPPGTVHKIMNNDDVTFYSLSFMPEFIDELSRTANFASAFLQSVAAEACVYTKITVPTKEQLRIKRIIEEIYFEFEKRSLAATETVKLYTAILITLFARIVSGKSNDSPLTESKNKKHLILYCIDYIKLNYFNKLTLHDMLRISTMSRSEFCTLFRQMTGYTFHEYLNTCRIRKACELIKGGNKISSICSFCGYEDSSTFYRNFVKIIGVSPAKYKSSNK